MGSASSRSFSHLFIKELLSAASAVESSRVKMKSMKVMDYKLCECLEYLYLVWNGKTVTVRTIYFALHSD